MNLSNEIIIPEEKLKLLLQDSFIRGFRTCQSIPDVDYQKEGYNTAESIILNLKGG